MVLIDRSYEFPFVFGFSCVSIKLFYLGMLYIELCKVATCLTYYLLGSTILKKKEKKI